jgi:hypothetical protein
LVQGAEAQNKQVDLLLENLNKATDRYFDKAVREGKVTFRGEPFKGTLAEYKNKIAKEKVRVRTLTSGGMAEIEAAIKQGKKDGDTIYIWGHSQNLFGDSGNMFKTPSGLVPQDEASKAINTAGASFTTCDPEAGVLRQLTITSSPWSVGPGGITPTDPKVGVGVEK